MLREFTQNGATLLLGCWVKHWHVNYSKYVRKTRRKWGGHVGVRIICHTKSRKHKPFHFSVHSARLLKQIFLHSLNVPQWNLIEGHTIKVKILTHAKPFYLVCECSLIKITFRPIMFRCTFNTSVFSKSRCRLIKLCYFEAYNKLRFLEWFNFEMSKVATNGPMVESGNCGDGGAGKVLIIVSMWVKITRVFKAQCQRMRGARWDQAWLLKLILITEPSFHKRCSRAEPWFIFHPSLCLQRTHCS